MDDPLGSRAIGRLRASPASRSDFEVVLAAVKHSGQALEYAAESLRGDRKIVSTAVATDGLALRFASRELRADKAIQESAVSQNGLALQFAINPRESVQLKAVKQNGLALEFAGIRNGPVALSAVKNTPLAIFFVDPNGEAYESLWMKVLRRDGLLLQYAPQKVRMIKEANMIALRQNSRVFFSIPSDLQKERSFVLLAVRKCDSILADWIVKRAPQFLKDRDIVLASVASGHQLLIAASPELLEDEHFLLEAIRRNVNVLRVWSHIKEFSAASSAKEFSVSSSVAFVNLTLRFLHSYPAIIKGYMNDNTLFALQAVLMNDAMLGQITNQRISKEIVQLLNQDDFGDKTAAKDTKAYRLTQICLASEVCYLCQDIFEDLTCDCIRCACSAPFHAQCLMSMFAHNLARNIRLPQIHCPVCNSCPMKLRRYRSENR